ncbi:MAG: phosphodiesterase, partial [Promethearchaeota archaeon]
AAGTIGHKTLHLLENDTGSDDAMHDWEGVFILYDPQEEITPGRTDAQIADIAPTILYLLNEKLPKDLDGIVIKNVKRT